MNRKFTAVIPGGFGTDVKPRKSDEDYGEHSETTTGDPAELLRERAEPAALPVRENTATPFGDAKDQVEELAHLVGVSAHDMAPAHH